MKKEKRTFGHISDGYGKRYLIFWLYLVLGDLEEAKVYFRWYEKAFEDDVGEPIQKLCWGLLVHRMGDDDRAKYLLADLMLSNLYLIPEVLGNPIDPYPIGFGSNYAGYEYAKEVPSEILGSITEEDRSWINGLYETMEFRRYRAQYLEIQLELEQTRGYKDRSPLVSKASGVLSGLRKHAR
ncbi:MAG: hypothetical protein AB8B96_00440 [Lysobacterales bacterium]